MWFRRKPEIHKRLMIVATTVLLVAAVNRMTFLGRPWPLLLVWCSPLLLGAAYDVVRRRAVPWIYLLGVVVIVVRSFSTPLVGETDVWHNWMAWLATVVT